MATEAFTKNFTVLSPGVITKTGASARLNEGSAAEAIKHNTASRILSVCGFYGVVVNPSLRASCGSRTVVLVLLFVVVLMLVVVVVVMFWGVQPEPRHRILIFIAEVFQQAVVGKVQGV